MLERVTAAIGTALPHRQRMLLTTLTMRSSLPQYQANVPTGEMCALVVGAGPIGLRCACELALLGCSVRVVESRERFSVRRGVGCGCRQGVG